MYPNPQDVLPLPARPDADHYRKRARELSRACRSGDADACHRWARRWIADLERLRAPTDRVSARDIERHIDQVGTFARERLAAADCAVTQAQFVIARAHGFESWPRLLRHIQALAGRRTAVPAFEEAADAIVAGDLATLERLLADVPGLARTRSSREHRATLLHYVAANGVENYRQRTPPNIVAIAARLLDAGAAVDAEADMYGGGATALGLVATSAHPRAMQVQDALADLLLDRGARLPDRIVRDCLANGCPEAAAHLARRGARVDLEGAAGIGLVEVVRRTLAQSPPPRDEAIRALMMAAWYGRADVVDVLLDHGVDVGARSAGDGDTALHIAAYGGHERLVEALIARNAPLDVTDAKYGTPPIVWALHAWLVERRTPDDAYRAIVRMLVNAGAAVKHEWVNDDRVRADPALAAALSRRIRP